MSDLNIVVLTGRLTRDSSLKYLDNGSAVLNFGIASNRIWSRDGDSHEEATYVDCALWGKRAETFSQHLTKGKKITVEGRLKLSTWDDSEGIKRSKLSVIADRINFLDTARVSGKEVAPAKQQKGESEDDVPFDVEPVVDFEGDM
jgi:single-strand DNA-binding protein